nr:hypothetical protein [Bradyrhizobium nanningense]
MSFEFGGSPDHSAAVDIQKARDSLKTGIALPGFPIEAVEQGRTHPALYC